MIRALRTKFSESVAKITQVLQKCYTPKFKELSHDTNFPSNINDLLFTKEFIDLTMFFGLFSVLNCLNLFKTGAPEIEPEKPILGFHTTLSHSKPLILLTRRVTLHVQHIPL